MKQAEIYAAIEQERARQAAKWNRAHAWGWVDCSSPQVDASVKVAVLAEEMGAVARAMLDMPHQDAAALRTALVHLAACCVAWLESL